MNPHYEQVALRAKHCCEYCHAPEVIFNFPFEVEHITPLSLGGSDLLSNLALSCRSCKLHKSAHITGIDDVTRHEVHLFSPRKNIWAEHFKVNIESGEVEGLTEVGERNSNAIKN